MDIREAIQLRIPEWNRNDAQFGGQLELKVNGGQYWGYSGREMMHTKEARVKGLCEDHIVKLEPVVYSGAMKIATD